MKNKKISLKASSMAVLTGVLSTASVISIAATTSHTNVATSNIDNNTVATNQAATVTTSQTTPISVTGVKAKITSYDVLRTTSQVTTHQTRLNSEYKSYGFDYPGVNHDYSDSKNSTITYKGKTIDLSKLVMDELVLPEYSNGTAAVWSRYNDASYIKSYLTNNKHYKHPAADGLYVNPISKVKAVTKQFNVDTTKKGSVSLGLFAAPGEKFTLKFDEATFKTLQKTKFSGLELIVNENNFEAYNTGSVSTKLTTRYPFTKTIFEIDYKSQSVTLESPFGGMLSLNIKNSLFDQTVDLATNNSNWINFEISGALETLQYIQGETTKADWENQISKVKSGAIYSSAVSLVGEFGSIIIPATGAKEFGGVSVDDMIYPEAVMKKWSDLGFLGSYLSRRDSTSLASRISYNFSNESYWGGGVTNTDNTSFYAPINSGGEAFLLGTDSFGSTKSQDVLTGLGFDYKQDDVLFKGSKISKANQAILPLLGILEDNTKGRNTTGVYGSADSFQDAYQTVNKIKNKQGSDETSIYTLLLYTVGPNNYISYLRYAAENNLNTKPGWTPMKEIEAMSKFFGINLYQAFVNSNARWSGGWPKSYSAATKEEKAIIDSLQANYPAMDFVANMYASGNYLLNGTKSVYTGDYAPAYEIPAGEDYTFDFGKYINSTSKSFNWSKLYVSAKSDQGVELQVDKKDSRKVIYKAGSKFATNDEFLVTVYPNFKNNKLKNYVPSYTWLIKVKQVTNSALVSTYQTTSTYDAITTLNKLKSNNLKNITLTNESYDLYSNKNNYFTNEKNTSVRYRFKFVAPETGRYAFSSLYSDSIVVYANKQMVYHDEKSSSGYKNVTYANLFKGQSIDFDILVTSTSGEGKFGMTAEYNKGLLVSNSSNKAVKLNLWDNVVIQNIGNAQKLASISSLEEFTNNQKYVYKPRSVNYFDYDSNAIYKIGATEVDYSVLNTNMYTFTPVKNVTQNEIDKLRDQATEFNLTNKKFFEFDVTFKTATKVSSLVFSHDLAKNINTRPEYIRVDATNEKGQKINLYQGAYGGQFNDKNSSWSGLNFTGNQKYKKLSFYITSNDSVKNISLRKLYISTARYYPTSNWSIYKDFKFNR